MSVLELPRIYFRGQTTFDPVTTNNYPRNYDEMGAQTVMTPDGSAEAFRKAAIRDVTIGSWNPHGTYRSQFYGTEICGVDLGAGTSTEDALVGSPVDFLGMLVDLEPFGSNSSQLFFDTMSFGIDGSSQVKAKRSTRMIARQINFTRNPTYRCIAGVASVVWQTSFPKGEGLAIAPHDSKALEGLRAALAQEDVLGLTVRWNAYRTIYYDNINCRNGNSVMKEEIAALIKKLEGGGFQPNPARTKLVGVLGLWREGDPAQVTGDRGLLQTEGAPWTRENPNPIATANARLMGKRLVIDLGNSISETGPDLTKRDLGTLQVKAGDAVIASLPPESYNKTAYEASAGIVTVDIDESLVTDAIASNLSVCGPDGTIYLQEKAFHVCELTPNVYVDQGQDTTLSVQVLVRGQRAPAGVPVRWINTSTSAPTSLVTLTDATGVASLPVSGATSNIIGQIDAYVATTEIRNAPTAVDTMTTAYLWVRTLPYDPTSAPAATWQNVYNLVLYNWHAMAPCMDNWLRLGDEQQVAAYGPLIRKLTDPANFEAYRFMPVTRDLTRNQRELLYRWLDTTQGTTRAAPSDAIAQAPQETPRQSNAKLSRSFRQGSS